MKKIYLSVVIPCYNEQENIKSGVLTEVYNFLKTQPYSWEVIVSDDGSTDKSMLLVERFAKSHKGFKALKNKHGGKPWAVWKGIESAKGKITLFTDMDQSTPISELEKLLPFFDRGYKIVIGSRGLKRQGAPLARQAMSVGFRVVRGVFALPGINDTQCGFKSFNTKVAREIFPKLQFFQDIDKEVKGWKVTAFDVELLFIAQKWGYKIKEVVVDWKDRDLSTGKMKNFSKESRQMAEEIIRVRINNLKGKYDK
jgi:dolichyl-phosphate beta-glucosyltransferase